MILISAPSAAVPPPRTALLEDDGRCDAAVAGARLGAAGIVVGALEASRPASWSSGAWLDVGAASGCMAQVACDCWGFSRCESVDTDATPGALDMTRGLCMPVAPFDGARLPFANASFDVVSFSFVLHHVGSAAAQRRLLDEAHRVSRRHLVIGEDTVEGDADRRLTRHHALNDGMNSAEAACDECYRSEAGWRQLLGEHGFEVERAADGNDFLDYNPFLRMAYNVSRRVLIAATRGRAGS